VTRAKTPGEKLRERLDKSLPAGAEWDERELVVLDELMSTANRRAIIEKHFRAEEAKPEPSASKLTALATELRQCSALIVRLAGSLAPNPDVGADAAPKSRQHQEAVNARWAKARRDQRSHRRAG